MQKNYYLLYRLAFSLLVLFGISGSLLAQPISSWSTTSTTGSEDSISATPATYVNGFALKRSAGLTLPATPTAASFNAVGWGTTFDQSLYFEFSITSDSAINADSLVFSAATARRGGPSTYEVRTSVDNFATAIFTGNIAGRGPKALQFPAGFTGLSSLTVRIFAFGANTTPTGNFRISNPYIEGTVGSTLPSGPPSITCPRSIALGNFPLNVADTGHFNFSGTNWATNSYLLATPPFGISLSPNGPFTDSIAVQGPTLTNVTVYYSITETASTVLNGDSVYFVSPPYYLAIPITGTAGTPAFTGTITATPDSINYGIVGLASVNNATFTLAQTGVTDTIYIVPPTDVEISARGGLNFTPANPLKIAPRAFNGTRPPTVNVRYTSTSTGPYLDSIRLTASTAYLAVPVKANVTSTPTILATPSLIDFGTVNIGSTNSGSFSISGANLTDTLFLTPPAGVDISTRAGVNFTPTNPIKLAPVTGTVRARTIYVQFIPQNSGSFLDSVTAISGTAASTAIVIKANVTSTVVPSGLATWNTNALPAAPPGGGGTPPHAVGATTATNIAADSLLRSPAITASITARNFSSSGWPSGTSPDTTAYLSFGLSAISGYLNLDSLSFTPSRSNTGATEYTIKTSADNYTDTLFGGTVPAQGGGTGATPTLRKYGFGTAFSNLPSVNFKLYAFNASATTGTFRVANVRITGIVVTGLEKQKNAIITLFPNPASEYINVVSPVNGVVCIKDALGRTIISQSVNGTEAKSISVVDLPKGIYNVSISSAFGTSNQRVVIK